MEDNGLGQQAQGACALDEQHDAIAAADFAWFAAHPRRQYRLRRAHLADWPIGVPWHAASRVVVRQLAGGRHRCIAAEAGPDDADDDTVCEKIWRRVAAVHPEIDEGIGVITERMRALKAGAQEGGGAS